MWVLTKITDARTAANEVTIHYYISSYTEGYAHRPFKLTYGEPIGGSSGDGYRVYFKYDNRTSLAEPLNEPKYATGTEYFGLQKYRLKGIRIYDYTQGSGQKNVRAYNLDYDLSAQTRSSLLAKVTEFGSDFVYADGVVTGASTLPPVEFEYSDGRPAQADPAFELKTYTGKIFTQNFLAWDKDKDGRDDLIFRDHHYYAEWDNGGNLESATSTAAGAAYTISFNRSPINDLTLPNEFSLQTEHPNFGSLTSGTTSYDDFFSSVYPFTGELNGPGELVLDLAIRTSKSVIHHPGGTPQSSWIETQASYDIWHPQSTPAQLSSLDLTVSDPETKGHFVGFFNIDNDPEPEALFVGADYTPGATISNPTAVTRSFDVILNSNSAPTLSLKSTLSTLYVGERPVPVDMNGDGKSHFFTFDNSGGSSASWRLLDASTNQVVTFARPYALENGSPAYTAQQIVGFGDLNGDGADDVAIYGASSGSGSDRVYVYFSNGKSFEPGEEWALPFSLGTYAIADALTLAVKDTNGDGLGDLIFEGRTPSLETVPAGFDSTSTFPSHYPARSTYVFLSTGTGIVQEDHQGATYTETSAKVPDAHAKTGDFDGDGILDFVGPGADGKIAFGNHRIPFLLNKIENQSGGETTATFLPSSGGGNHLLPSVTQLVSSITSSDGRGVSRTVDYVYEGGRFDYHLRRSLGFAKVTATLPAVGNSDLGSGAERPRIETEYVQTRAGAGRVRKQTIYGPYLHAPRSSHNTSAALGSEVTLSEVEHTYLETGALDDLPMRVQKTETERSVLYGNSTISQRTEYAWTEFGEPSYVKEYGYEGGYDDITSQYWYKENEDKYIVNRPRRKLTLLGDAHLASWNRDDRTKWINVEYYYYDGHASFLDEPASGNLTKVKFWDGVLQDGNGDNYETVTRQQFEYDTHGNQTKAIDAGGRETLFEFGEPRKLFQTKVTNALLHEETTSWDTKCQAPLSVTDPNGSVTSFEYDVHCREVKKTLPNSGLSSSANDHLTTSYHNLGDPTGQYVERTGPAATDLPGQTNRITTREYFDGFGQTYLTARSGADEAEGSMILAVNEFDALGNVSAQSLPLSWSEGNGIITNTSFTLANDKKTRFEYDGLNRLVRTRLPDGNQTEVSFTTYSFDYDIPLEYYGYSDDDGTGDERFPLVRSWDEHCFDGEDTQCGVVDVNNDRFGNIVRTRVKAYDDSANGSYDTGHSTSFRYDPRGNLLLVKEYSGMDIIWEYTYDHYSNRLTAEDPGLGRWTMEYDVNNNLIRQVDAKDQYIEFTYDDLDRVLTKKVGTNGQSSYVQTTSTYDTYDGTVSSDTSYPIGLLGRVEVAKSGHSGSAHRIDYSYDRMGRVKRTSYTVDGDANRRIHLKNYYYDDGSVMDIRASNTPGGTTTKRYPDFIYDTSGRLLSFGNYITGATYNLWDQPTRVDLGNGHHIAYTYDDERGWIKKITPEDASNAYLPGFTNYHRTATGRVYRTYTYKQKSRYRYSYDFAGRLLKADQYISSTEAEGANTTYDQTFTYDKAGRMLSNSFIGTYSYPTATSVGSNGNSPHSHAPDSVDGETLTYDDNGNMLNGYDGKVMTYDAENRPLSVTKDGTRTEYVYGADGTRLKKLVGPDNGSGGFSGTPEVTAYFGMLEFRDWGGSTSEKILFYPHSNVRIQTTTSGEEISYLIQDQLGSTRAIYDDAGCLMSNPTYEPYGVQNPHVETCQTTPETKGFIGERYDAEAGLQYLNARYYDPELGLFIQPDWFEVTVPGVGTNRYSYSFNDPVNLSDPLGNAVEGTVTTFFDSDGDGTNDSSRSRSYETAAGYKAATCNCSESKYAVAYDAIFGTQNQSVDGNFSVTSSLTNPKEKEGFGVLFGRISLKEKTIAEVYRTFSARHAKAVLEGTVDFFNNSHLGRSIARMLYNTDRVAPISAVAKSSFHHNGRIAIASMQVGPKGMTVALKGDHTTGIRSSIGSVLAHEFGHFFGLTKSKVGRGVNFEQLAVDHWENVYRKEKGMPLRGVYEFNSRNTTFSKNCGVGGC